MAATTATVTYNNYPKGIDNTQRRIHAYGTIAIGASPLTYATGGIALAFVGSKSAEGTVVVLDTTSTVPEIVWLAGVGGSGYQYGWNKATNKIQIFTGAAAQSPLTELTNAAAIPAGVSGDVIVFEAEFIRANG